MIETSEILIRLDAEGMLSLAVGNVFRLSGRSYRTTLREVSFSIWNSPHWMALKTQSLGLIEIRTI